MIIDLMAGLREIGSTRSRTGGGAAAKMVVDVQCSDFKLNLNEPELAGAMSIALVNQIRANILAGRKLDGTPAKALAESTIERREYRRAQGARGGSAADRYRDKKFKSDVKKHWRERFRAPRAGTFNPATSPASITTRAVESGLLIGSMAAEPQSDGTWRIFFANIRALTDRTGQAPVGRALGMAAVRAAEIARLMKSPPIKAKLEFVLQSAINTKGGKGPSLLAELQKSVQLAGGIAGELEG